MRLLHVTPSYWPATEIGGPVRADRLLVAALEKAGVDVEVLTTDARGAATLPRLVPGRRLVDGVPVTYCRSLGHGSVRVSRDLAIEVAKRVRHFDLVHVHGIWTFPVSVAAAACWRAGVPYVLTPQGCLQSWPLSRAWLKKQAHLALIGRRVLRRAAALHFTTEHERRTTAAFARELPSFVVPNAVEVAVPFEPEAVPAHLGSPPRVLILGRVHPIKGFDLLLPAMARVRRAVPGVRLQIVGPDEGGYLGEVQLLARQHGMLDAIEITGMVPPDETRAIFEQASLLVAPSRSESFCMAAAEAMAAGLPVVVSDQVGLHEAVREADAGIVVPCRTAELGDAITRLLLDERAREGMGRRGRALATKELRPEVVAEAMFRAYTRLLQS